MKRMLFHRLLMGTMLVPLTLLLSSLSLADVLRVERIWSHASRSCAALSNGQLKCWGHNPEGVLGQETMDPSRGGQSQSMGDSLPVTDLGTTSPIMDLSMGWYATCARLADGGLKCWGYVGSIRPGFGYTLGEHAGDMGMHLPYVEEPSAAYRNLPTLVKFPGICAARPGGKLACNDGRTDFSQLPLYQISEHGGEITQLVGTLENRTSCALVKSENAVYCWGQEFIPLGGHIVKVRFHEGETVRKVAMGSSIGGCILFESGSIKCWGSNNYGQLGMGQDISGWPLWSHVDDEPPSVDLGNNARAIDLAVGRDHSCALLSDGRIKCWGLNDDGQLGLGDASARGRAGTMGDLLPAADLGGMTAVAVTAGIDFSCALLLNGGVKCWGRNTYGQLGLEDTRSRGANPGEMGSNLPFVRLWD